MSLTGFGGHDRLFQRLVRGILVVGILLTAPILRSGPEVSGEAAATVALVKDINPGASAFISSNPAQLVAIGDVLYFSATSTAFGGTELWKSDGTAAGTALVKDINPIGSSSPTGLTNVNGTLFFSASDGAAGVELWKNDGR